MDDKKDDAAKGDEPKAAQENTKESNHNILDSSLNYINNENLDREKILNGLHSFIDEGKITEEQYDLISYAADLKEWPDPLPITELAPSTPYPIEALPYSIRSAVQEVGDFVQCPISLAACSALSALSLAGQALLNVRRAQGLSGPIGLYIMAIAESGERKTTCDNYFSVPISLWQNRQGADLEKQLLKYKGEVIIWEEEIAYIKQRIKKSFNKSDNITLLQSDLERVIAEKPEPPLIPKLLYVDTTPEALAWGLASDWHSAGIITSEAGLIFGSHGMNKESVMRNLALLNVLWDGGEPKVNRRSSENFIVKGARLTIGIAVQPDAILNFYKASKGLARGMGFTARFLITCPQSTQGTRLFREAPDWCMLAVFNNRLEELLDEPLKMNVKGEIEPDIIDLSSEAKKLWVQFHDEIEIELRPGGEMAMAKDVASKAADNVTRVAALFHLYQYGINGEISADLVQRAYQIVKWHLYEAKRFLGEIALPIDLLNACTLNDWLVNHLIKNGLQCIRRRDVQRLCPNSVREPSYFNKAVAILIEMSRVIETDDPKNIYVNPKLLKKI